MDDRRSGQLPGKEDLIQQNKELQTTVDTLTEQNNVLLQDQAELARLEQLYELDEEYYRLSEGCCQDHFQRSRKLV